MKHQLNGLSKRNLGLLLTTELKYSEEVVLWHYERLSAEGLRSVIRNHRTMVIIAKLANK